MRHDKTERLGVIETDRIVTKDLDWIFREQAIVDVGIDAIIEQSIEGAPTGKFIAVQIKTGAGNFHITENKIIYYASHIHYNYWLNLDIPIILIAHIPETEKTYWQIISEKTFLKTKKQWKIEIPKTQEFNLRAKNKLTQILSIKNQRNLIFNLYKGNLEENSLFDIVESIECIKESKESLERITSFISELGIKANDFNKKVRDFAEEHLTDKDEQVKAGLKGFARTLNIISKRFEDEIEIYSALYAEGIYSYEAVISTFYLLTKNKQNLALALEGLVGLPSSVDIALVGIYDMKGGISKLPTKHSVLKESKLQLLEVVDLFVNELNVSKKLAEILIEKINSLIHDKNEQLSPLEISKPD